jgi:hypothetical protein
MKPSILRLLLTCLLLIAIPLQGFAVPALAGMAHCDMAMMDINSGSTTSATAPAQASHTPAPCKHCNPYCSASPAPLNTHTLLPLPAPGAEADFPPLTQSLPSAPIHLPERPPRA